MRSNRISSAANTRGFIGGYPYSRHTMSVAPIAGKGANMQRDDWYSSARDPTKLAAPEASAATPPNARWRA